MHRLKFDATILRDAGYSYGMISSELGISKSTLSNWFRDRPYTPNEDALLRVAEGQERLGLRLKSARLAQMDKMSKIGRSEVGRLNERDLWMLGLGLWLGEGSKTGEQLRLANSDPTIIALWLRWLREIGGFSEENICVRIHAYADVDEDEAIVYWQNVTNLPNASFYKTIRDMRTGKSVSKTGKLPFGTLHVSVISNHDPLKGVQFHRKMMGWISAVLA